MAQQPSAGPGVGAAVLPGGFDEELAGIGVPGLGDWSLAPGLAGGVFDGNHSKIRPDGGTGEASPVPDLHGQPEPCRELDARRHINGSITGP